MHSKQGLFIPISSLRLKFSVQRSVMLTDLYCFLTSSPPCPAVFQSCSRTAACPLQCTTTGVCDTRGNSLKSLEHSFKVAWLPKSSLRPDPKQRTRLARVERLYTHGRWCWTRSIHIMRIMWSPISLLISISYITAYPFLLYLYCYPFSYIRLATHDLAINLLFLIL